jgi:23S rRNA pseudouridine1911/1915/1917 synthase
MPGSAMSPTMTPDPAPLHALPARVIVTEEEEHQRLDLLLGPYCEGLSRSRIQTLIKEGAITVADRVERASYKVRQGDRIDIDLPDPKLLAVEPQPIPLDILFEDRDLLVVNKPAGMTVHPAPGVWRDTLVNALLHHCQDLSGINGVLRPGIVHRLDRYTTGLLVVAKNDASHQSLAAQLHERAVKRQYTAVAWGWLDDGRIEAPIARHPRERTKMAVREGGRAAVTHYAAAEHFSFLTRLTVNLETGRTHQIRVHLLHIGHPIFGDPVYGGRTQTRGIQPDYRQSATSLLSLIGRQALHAHHLSFRHPASGEMVSFEAPLAPDMEELVAACRAS